MSLILKPSGQSHLVSAALPGSGALTSQPVITLVAKTLRVVASITYTYGAAGGQARFRPMWTIAGVEQQGTVQDTTLDVSVAPFGRQSVYLQEVNGLVPATSAAIGFPVAFDVQAGATAFRLLAYEAGQPGTPGTCAITLSGVVDL